jgi:hypothetical protein
VLSCAKDRPRHRRTAACQAASGEDRGDSIPGARGIVGSTVAASQSDSVRADRTYQIDRLLTWSTTAFEVLIRSSVTTIHHNNTIEGHAIHGTARPSSQYRRLFAQFTSVYIGDLPCSSKPSCDTPRVL